METIRFENYTFSYPGKERPALSDIDFVVNQGEFITICGKSGSGKSTLLKSMKPEISPHGEKMGKILFCSDEFEKTDKPGKIGYVMQNPDNQIVTDTVWHELSFGLENIGMEQGKMRVKVAEIASFFGIEDWFYKSTSNLSGGQKQLLNLAAVMVMEPEVLILDEPTGQLDPVTAGEFFSVIKRINTELGTTIIISEHRLEEIFPYTDRLVVMEKGKIVADCAPYEAGKILKQNNSDMFLAMPSAVRIFETVSENGKCPVSVADARSWLYKSIKEFNPQAFSAEEKQNSTLDVAVSVRNLHYRYEKNSPEVLSGLSLEVKKGEIFALLGGNGSGKSTFLWLICDGLKMQNGKKRSFGKIGMLPQNPESLFVKNTVLEELSEEGSVEEAKKILTEYEMTHLENRHPYDLSGGEQQKLALSKVLLTKPQILLLDEPTKGLDAHFKAEFKKILLSLQKNGVSIIMVSHDVEFAAETATRCGLLFAGEIISTGTPRDFFSGKKFYTTQTARIFKGICDNVVLAEDAIKILKNKGEI